MTDQLHTVAAEVTRELSRRSIPATFEYPGYILMPFDGWSLNAGTVNGKWDCDCLDRHGATVAVAESDIPADSTDAQAITEFIVQAYYIVVQSATDVLRVTHKPHRLATDAAGDQWEFISWPYAQDGKIAINIRVPGDPTSMIVAEARLMTPERRACLCADAGRDFYLEATYYQERAARLQQCPALLRRD